MFIYFRSKLAHAHLGNYVMGPTRARTEQMGVPNIRKATRSIAYEQCTEHRVSLRHTTVRRVGPNEPDPSQDLTNSKISGE